MGPAVGARRWYVLSRLFMCAAEPTWRPWDHAPALASKEEAGPGPAAPAAPAAPAFPPRPRQQPQLQLRGHPCRPVAPSARPLFVQHARHTSRGGCGKRFMPGIQVSAGAPGRRVAACLPREGPGRAAPRCFAARGVLHAPGGTERRCRLPGRAGGFCCVPSGRCWHEPCRRDRERFKTGPRAVGMSAATRPGPGTGRAAQLTDVRLRLRPRPHPALQSRRTTAPTGSRRCSGVRQTMGYVVTSTHTAVPCAAPPPCCVSCSGPCPSGVGWRTYARCSCGAAPACPPLPQARPGFDPPPFAAQLPVACCSLLYHPCTRLPHSCGKRPSKTCPRSASTWARCASLSISCRPCYAPPALHRAPCALGPGAVWPLPLELRPPCPPLPSPSSRARACALLLPPRMHHTLLCGWVPQEFKGAKSSVQFTPRPQPAAAPVPEPAAEAPRCVFGGFARWLCGSSFAGGARHGGGHRMRWRPVSLNSAPLAPPCAVPAVGRVPLQRHYRGGTQPARRCLGEAVLHPV